MARNAQQAPSVNSQEQDPKEDKKAKTKTKSRRPPNTAFRQQRLKAWQPILTPKTVLPLFFTVGIIFAPIGGLLLWASALVEELTIDYSRCIEQAKETFTPIPEENVRSIFKSNNATNRPAEWRTDVETVSYGPGADVETPVCFLRFEIPNDIGPPVLFYYRLSNFYQNHRRYVRSMDTAQLGGEARSAAAINSGDCEPLTTDGATGKPYYPCGLIANSIFNDTFFSPVLLEPAGEDGDSETEGRNETYFMTDKGIAWGSDRELYGVSQYKPEDVMPPPNWRVRYPNPDGYNEDFPLPNLQEDEAFHVWMRTAALPTFSKLALRNDNATMRAGRYQVKIHYYFPVLDYGATKSILISTRTVMGGRNPFLGIAYVVVGGVCVLLGAVFTATHLIRPRKLGDHTYLSWNNDQPSSATTTGRAPRAADSA